MDDTQESSVPRMETIQQFSGVLHVLGSGLRIGGTKEVVDVGERENSIIRHPITRVPYVPGSSVKGKLRCLLEQRHGKVTQVFREIRGKRTLVGYAPCDCGTCCVCDLFGCGDPKKTKTVTRLVFRDSQPTDDTLAKWKAAGLEGEIVTEIKSEVQIDRKTGKSGGGGPRTMERIPAFSDFSFAFSLRTFEGDPVAEYYRFLAEGFELLSKHYLGGSGSRGYGEVAIEAEDGTPMHEYLRNKAQEAERAKEGR